MSLVAPTAIRSDTGWQRPLAILLIASVAVRVAYLAIKPASVYSIDVQSWRNVAGMIARGENPYPSGVINWLPVWPAIIAAIDFCSHRVGVSFVAMLWGFLVLVEMILMILTFRTLCRFISPKDSRNVLLVAVALNPAAVFQVTQHGSFDVLFMVFVVLSITSMMNLQEHGGGREWLIACAWLGLGVLTKTIPLALAPLLALGARRLSGAVIAIGIALLTGPPLVALAVIYLSAPQAVTQHVIRYHSYHGFFGLGGLLAIADGVEFPEIGPLGILHQTVFLMVFPIVLAGMTFVCWRVERVRAAAIPAMAGLIFVAIICFGTGFGTQYVYWMIPLLAIAWGGIEDPRWRKILVIGCIVIGATYTFEYLVLPPLGGLLRALAPQSDRLYRLTLPWLRSSDQTLLLLPMFCVLLGILIEGLRTLLRSSPAGPSPRPSASDTLPPPLPAASDRA